MQRAPPDYSDTQGLARFRFRTLTEACFFLLKIEKASLACSWLARAPITTAVELSQPPDTALQVALTSAGLRAMGVPDEVLKGFSAEFISGMAGEDSRSRRLGDIGDNAPVRWQWGREGSVPHALVMLYAKPDHFAARKAKVQQEIRDGGFSIQTCLATSDLGGAEPFGFTDGISQPAVDWNRERALTGEDQLEYGNLLALGELLLGYPNEYGKYTDRPLLARQQQSLPPAEDDAGKVDLGRNGTYLVFRQLRQDVRGFWRYLSQKGLSLEEGRRLAQAMVGRSMSGAPLEPTSVHDIAGIGKDATSKRLNGFTYDADSNGARCPLGAHIRRANPRTGDLPGRSGGAFSWLVRMLGFARGGVRDDVLASARFHRLVRCGREYGPGLPPEQAVRPAPPDDPERGLHFICLNANIARQFEFIQNAWIMSTQFSGLSQESDPLLGNRQSPSSRSAFSLQCQNGVRECLSDVPQFVTVRGGAYFFLPGLRALRHLASFGAYS